MSEQAPAPPIVRETNTSIVVLVGDRAYKVKKPVDLGFLDFSTVERRGRACSDELALNRRLSPDVYLEVLTMTGSDGRVCEYVLAMRRMPDELRLSTMIANGLDVTSHVRAVARMLAAFHARAERGPQITEEAFGGLRRRWQDNLRETERFRSTLLPDGLHEQISERALNYLDGRTQLFADRAARGRAVDGHADLIADDVFCLPDHPRVLDCLEFDPRLRYVDVLDDAAFLAMDLEHLGEPDLAARFLDWYAEFSATPSVRSLEHHYIAYRAYVRAKVACIRADQGDAAARPDVSRFAEQTLQHLRSGTVRLVVVGGGPATGKSTIAGRLADELGAALLSTDALRRELLPFGTPDRYGVQAKKAVYAELVVRTRRLLERGESVVADATWGSEDERARIVAAAHETCSKLIELECRVPLSVATDRARARIATGTSLSEAGPDEVQLLSARDPWPRAVVLDTNRPVDDVVRGVLASIVD